MWSPQGACEGPKGPTGTSGLRMPVDNPLLVFGIPELTLALAPVKPASQDPRVPMEFLPFYSVLRSKVCQVLELILDPIWTPKRTPKPAHKSLKFQPNFGLVFELVSN